MYHDRKNKYKQKRLYNLSWVSPIKIIEPKKIYKKENIIHIFSKIMVAAIGIEPMTFRV